MIGKRLVRCLQCNAVGLFTKADRGCEYRGRSEKWEVVPRDDRASFMRIHGGHALEDLHIIEDSFISRRNYIEPVKTSYFEATNGKDRFVVKKSRRDVSGPQRYELIQGKLLRRLDKPVIDRTVIRRELERMPRPPGLTSEKIGSLLKEFDETVSGLALEDLERIPFESENPSEWFHSLDERAVATVLERCAAFLDQEEVRFLRRAVLANRQEKPFMVMTRVTFRIQRDPSPPSGAA